MSGDGAMADGTKSGHGRRLAVLVWTPKADDRIDSGWVEAVGSKLDAPVYSIGQSGPGLVPLGDHRNDLDGALKALSGKHPDRAVLVIRAGLDLPEPLSALERLLEANDLSDVTVFPGNYSDLFNPFRAWPAQIALENPVRMVYWCASGRWQWVDSASRDCMLLAPGIAGTGAERIGRAPYALIDQTFAFDPAKPLVPELESDSDAPSLPLGELRLRLRHLALSGPEVAAGAEPGSPVTLHIAHNWGGGVWRWIEDFIAGDSRGVNLVLVADGDRSGEFCGRGLKLFVGGIGRGLIREIPLAPGILSTVAHHSQYRSVLIGLIERYGVGRIIVSSLIGHSLDCLETGLPTIQVLHDFYPVWPLLDFDPLPFVDKKGGLRRSQALARHGDTLRMRPRDAAFWNRIAAAWRRSIAKHDVRLVAPADHVIERWKALNPGSGLEIRKIPHAFRPFADTETAPLPDPDERLHLVIPGRLTRGKGLELLEQALPQIPPRVRLTALGCGREAFKLFGRSGIDLIIHYQHAEFPFLIRKLRPHAALFLSTVPETWNYALSEVRALGLVPIATRVGSFPERIRDGQDGLLFDPDAQSLVELIQTLAETPERLADLNPGKQRQQTPAQLVSRFDRLLSVELRPGAIPSSMEARTVALEKIAGDFAELEAEHAALEAECERLNAEIGRRTRWAEKLERQFQERSQWAKSLQDDLASTRNALARVQEEFKERTEWARSLDRELASARAAYAKLQEALEERTEWARRLDAQVREQARALARQGREYHALAAQHEELAHRHEELGLQHEQLQSEFAAVINSRSWKLTRPLRFIRRVATRKRLRQTVNPLQWIRMSRVFAFYWRTRGFRGALDALQHPPREEPQTATFSDAQLLVPQDVAAPVELRPAERPVVSIIIPVYNQLAYTAACLESIASVRTDVEHEVIVVDDASSDSTQEWLRDCQGIRVLRNRRNKGFIGTCNRGARKARGQYLVFLNNDTRVTDGWLDALVKTFESRPDAGIVGARLVFANGTLQEAGGIVFRDGSGWNFGRGDNPDRPVYGFVSDADYVSGACLAIARERFAALGGFDTHYAPAYYEDTDLCFKVRQEGLAVIYQPAATVIHFEGATSGTDESSGAKRYQAVNREKFRRRWAQFLESHPENPEDYSDELARQYRFRRFRGRALVIDAVTPRPDHDSGSVRMFAMLRLLGQLGYRTSFMPQNLAWAGRHSVDLQQAGIEVLTNPWVRHPEDWLAEAGDQLDLVIVSRHYVLAPLLKMLRKHCPRARVIFDTVDLHFLREQREAELAGTPAALRAAENTRSEELGLIERADATLVVSEYERGLLAELRPSARVWVVSNIHSLQSTGLSFEQREGLVFVGGFQHPPNLDAVEWLIDEILPEVRRTLPEVTLHIIGSKMPEALARRAAPGLRIHGFVPDLEPYMTGCRVSVAPLRYGAGVKGKVNQAMSHGLPVVATSCAAEGMYAEHGRELLIADDAVTFAAEVCRVYQNRALWQRLAENGRRNVEQHFSLDAARRSLEALLTEPERVR